MTKELEKKLFKKYPLIFQDKDKSVKESLIPFGFECGDGWYNIINRLCSNLQWNTDHNDEPQIIAAQVKEKFGSLHFYIRGGTESQNTVISFVESLSYHICEKCGSMKDIGHTGGWITTLCEECAKDSTNWKKDKV